MPCQNVPAGSQPLPHRQLHAEGADHSNQEEQDTHLRHNCSTLSGHVVHGWDGNGSDVDFKSAL